MRAKAGAFAYALLHPAGVIIRYECACLCKPFFYVDTGVEENITPRIECSGPHNEFRFGRKLRQDFVVREGHQLCSGKDPIHFIFQKWIVFGHFIGVAVFFSDKIGTDRRQYSFEIGYIRNNSKIYPAYLGWYRKTCIANDD
jgi:hypothetical protein